MKSISGKEFARPLERKGWTLKRTKDSHHVFVKYDNPARISVPIHGSQPLKVGLLRHLMRLAEITEDEL